MQEHDQALLELGNKVTQFEEALASSRQIGGALGIIMAYERLTGERRSTSS